VTLIIARHLRLEPFLALDKSIAVIVTSGFAFLTDVLRGTHEECVSGEYLKDTILVMRVNER
jgi:hypothetical protein